MAAWMPGLHSPHGISGIEHVECGLPEVPPSSAAYMCPASNVSDGTSYLGSSAAYLLK